MKKTFILYFIVISSANLAVAQLPAEYEGSVYEEVKHPNSVLDSLHVLSKRTFLFRNEYIERRHYYLFEKHDRDSVLIAEYLYDPVERKVSIESGMLFREPYKKEYYLTDKSKIDYTVYPSYVAKRKGFHLFKKVNSYYATTWYERDHQNRITSSKHTFYRESWRQSHSKGRKFSYEMDSSSYIYRFYNLDGFIDSVITRDNSSSYGSLDTTISLEVYAYNDDKQLESVQKFIKSINWHRKAKYGLLWGIRQKMAPMYSSHWNDTSKILYTYDENRQLIQKSCILDSPDSCLEKREYNSYGKLSLVVKICNGKEFEIESYEYDSFQRVSRKFISSTTWSCNLQDPRITTKTIIFPDWRETTKYEYNQDG
ncbi:MAG: hypothetical protein ACPGTP_06995, partial [Bacteroidia bacterium]